MKKFAIISVVFGILLMFFGCEKEPEKIIEYPKFTLYISPETDTVVVGSKVPITIGTDGGDSLTFSADGTATVHSYTHPEGLNGVWYITDTLYVGSDGANLANIAAFQFIEGIDDPIVKSGQSSIVGRHPELTVAADQTLIPWRTNALITIKTIFCDSLWTDLPGVDGLNGIYSTPVLDTTTTYHFKLFNSISGDVIEASETIYVKDPTRADTISNKCGPPWLFTGLAFSPDGVVWNVADIRYCASDNTQEFCLNPEQKAYMRFGEIRCDTEQDVVNPWHLSSNGEFLFRGESELWPLRITKLTIDTLEYTYHYSGFDITRETWTR